MQRLLFLSLSLCLALVSACDDESNTNPNTCITGATSICNCTLDLQGVQTCQPDGTFSACMCEGADVVSDTESDSGTDTSGSDTAGTDTTGTDTAGQDTAGQDTAGQDTAGQDTAGQDTTGQDTTGTDTSGTDTASGDTSLPQDTASLDTSGDVGPTPSCDPGNAPSSLGCAFYAVDLDNIDIDTTAVTPDDLPFGLALSNPHPSTAASVEVVGGGCGSDNDCPGSGVCASGTCEVVRSVAPRSTEILELNTTTDVNDSGVHTNVAFHITSTVPVAVHQLNPIAGVEDSFSNDASLLLPLNALDSEYLTLAHMPTRDNDNMGQVFNGVPDTCSSDGDCGSSYTCGGEGYCVASCSQEFDCDLLCTGCDVLACDTTTSRCELPAAETHFTDVVATVDGTTVTITSPTALPALSIPADTPTDFTLNDGDLLHILSTNGSRIRITADNPIAVFTGATCGNIPFGTSYCDHLEQQLLPTSTWGTDFVAAKSATRGTEDDFWRIIANEDTTVITLNPGQTDVATDTVITTKTLVAGEVLELKSTSDFEVSADKRIMVGQFWVGSNYPGVQPAAICNNSNIFGTTCTGDSNCTFFAGDKCDTTEGFCYQTCTQNSDCTSLSAVCDAGRCASQTGIGDPSFALTAPTQQFLSEYIVAVPPGYHENYLTLAVPTGQQVQLDGATLTDTPDILDSTWDIYRLNVTEGAHTLTSTQPFGVTAYGYNCDVSYAYPGGLNLLQLN